MTATPTPEAPAAPITENSAHAGPDRPPRDGPDRFEGRKLVIASAHGAQDADDVDALLALESRVRDGVGLPTP